MKTSLPGIYDDRDPRLTMDENDRAEAGTRWRYRHQVVHGCYGALDWRERNGGGAVTFEPGRAAIIPEIIKTLTSVGSAPSTLRDLIGYRLRVVHADDPDPLIFYRARVNIHVDDDDRIVDISFH